MSTENEGTMGGEASFASEITGTPRMFRVRTQRLVKAGSSFGDMKVTRNDLLHAIGDLIDIHKNGEQIDVEKYEQLIVDAQFNNPMDVAIPSWWDKIDIHAFSEDGSVVGNDGVWLWAVLSGPRTEEKEAAYAAAGRPLP